MGIQVTSTPLTSCLQPPQTPLGTPPPPPAKRNPIPAPQPRLKQQKPEKSRGPPAGPSSGESSVTPPGWRCPRADGERIHRAGARRAGPVSSVIN